MSKIKVNEISKHDNSEITVNDDVVLASGKSVSSPSISTDTISEKTSASGVTIDSVLIKDGQVDGVDVSALNTTVGNITSGLTKVGDQSFTTESAVTFDSVFSSTYDNYKVIIYTQNSASNTEFNFRFRDGSGDISSSNYNAKAIYGLSSSATPFANSAAYGQGVSGGVIASGMGNNTPYNFSMDIWNPNVAVAATLFATGSNVNGHTFAASGSLNVTTQLTGIKFYQASGTITGSIQIYGYDT